MKELRGGGISELQEREQGPIFSTKVFVALGLP